MSRCKLPLSADDLVRLQINEFDQIEGEFAFTEKQTVIAIAVKWAIRFGASTKIHDELIQLALKQVPVGGLHYGLLLAPRAGVEMKDHLLAVMLGPFQTHNVDRVINYSRDVLDRELSLDEVRKMSKWFSSCSSDSDKEERERLLGYIKKTHPKHLDDFEEYFRKEDEFWEGPGSIL